MDLQEIKKEIESLKKDTSTFSSQYINNNTKSLLGFSYLKIALTAVVSALLIYIAKPIYIFNLTIDEDKKIIKKTISYTKILLSFVVCFIVLLGVQKLPIF